MPMNPFARLEAQASTAVFCKLSNAVVSIDGGDQFGGIFDDEAATGNVGAVGMATTQPTLLVPATRVPAYSEGLPVSVDGRAYLISEAYPDGTDVRLQLELAT